MGEYTFWEKVRLWFCKYLGWHNGRGGAMTHDGCSFHATCSICGKEVMMDSQGNWF